MAETCTNCKKGFYKDFVGDKPCVPCPDGSTTVGTEDNDSVTKCITPCIPGFGKDPNTGSCASCPAGTYNEDGVGPCKPCPKEKWSDGASTSCDKCGDGYSLVFGKCAKCPRGEYRDKNDWTQRCNSCNKGKTTPGMGSKHKSECTCAPGDSSVGDRCDKCPMNTFKADFGSGQCEPCPSGLCAKGKESLTDPAFGKTCTYCRKGFYKDFVGDKPCVACPDGSTTMGTYNNINKSNCTTRCIGGKTRDPESKKCEPCPEGTYNEIGTGPCKPCTINRWSDKGRTACTKCADGYGFELTSYDCQLCPIGQCHEWTHWNDRCLHCGDGKSTNGTGTKRQSECLCDKGKEPTSADNCTECKKGFYKDFVGDEPCVPCPDGFTTIGTNDNDNVSDCSMKIFTISETWDLSFLSGGRRNRGEIMDF